MYIVICGFVSGSLLVQNHNSPRGMNGVDYTYDYNIHKKKTFKKSTYTIYQASSDMCQVLSFLTNPSNAK